MQGSLPLLTSINATVISPILQMRISDGSLMTSLHQGKSQMPMWTPFHMQPAHSSPRLLGRWTQAPATVHLLSSLDSKSSYIPSPCPPMQVQTWPITPRVQLLSPAFLRCASNRVRKRALTLSYVRSQLCFLTLACTEISSTSPHSAVSYGTQIRVVLSPVSCFFASVFRFIRPPR